MQGTAKNKPRVRAGARRALRAVLILVACCAWTLRTPSAADASPRWVSTLDRTLAGKCVDGRSAPCKGTVHAFFDIPRTAEGEPGIKRVDAPTQADGTYRIDVPDGATSATLRAKVKSELHFGATVWLLGANAADGVIDVDPIRCGKLTSAELEVRMDDGETVEEGGIYYFTEKEFPGDTSPLLGSTRACRLVATIEGSANILIPALPSTGGYLRVEGTDCGSVVQRLSRKRSDGTFAETFTLTFAPTIEGLAPGTQLYGDNFHGRKVKIAVLSDPVASNGPNSRAFAAYFPARAIAEYEVVAGQLFYFGGIVGYSPVLGAWIDGENSASTPDLISASNPVTGRYDTWVPAERSVFRIKLPKVRGAAAKKFAEARLWATITVNSTRGTYGDEIEIKQDEKKSGIYELSPKAGRSTGGQAELELRADGAILFHESVDYAPGASDVEIDSFPELTVLRLTVLDRVTEKPVAGAKVAAFLESDDPSYPCFQFETDENGEASALFLAHEEIRLVPDATQFSQVDPMVVTTEPGETPARLAVGQGFGSLKVHLGQVDDETCRVSLMPVGVPPFVQSRVVFPSKGKELQGWSVEATREEIAAAAIRPGGTFTFERLPEGEYLVALETDLDVTGTTLYTDARAAYGNPLAQKVVIRSGKTAEVTLDAPPKKSMSIPVVVCKQLAKDLKYPKRSGITPSVRASDAVDLPDILDWDRESDFDIPMEMLVDPAIAGELVEGWPYVVRISGVGPVDSMHLARPGSDKPIRLDGAFDFEIQGKGKGPCTIEISAEPFLEDGRRVRSSALEAVLTIKPKRGRIRLDGFSPWAKHNIKITRDGKSTTLELDPLGSDRMAKPDRRTKALLRAVKVTLR